MDILSWKNKEETGVIFLSINLTFYLLLISDYSLISIFGSIWLVMIAVININSFMNKTSSDGDHYLYLSKETLEEVFVLSFDIGKGCCSKIQKGFEDKLQVILGLIIFSWVNELFGTIGLLWVITLIAFIVTPQYFGNKDIVDQQINQITNKIAEAKNLVIDIIPKYKGNN